MNSQTLARDYLRKGKARRRALQVLFEEGSYDDVVREAQAIVELILKQYLRQLDGTDGMVHPSEFSHPGNGLINKNRLWHFRKQF